MMDEGATAASKHNGLRIAGANERRSMSHREAAHLLGGKASWDGMTGALPRIAQYGRQRKESSGAALSSWPVEPQALHKQNKTWGLAGDLWPETARLRVAVCVSVAESAG